MKKITFILFVLLTIFLFPSNIEPKYKINDNDNILPVRIVITNRNEDVTITGFAYKL